MGQVEVGMYSYVHIHDTTHKLYSHHLDTYGVVPTVRYIRTYISQVAATRFMSSIVSLKISPRPAHRKATGIVTSHPACTSTTSLFDELGSRMASEMTC